MAPPIVKRFWISLKENAVLGFFSWAVIVGISGVFAASQQEQAAPPPSFKSTGLLTFNNPPPSFTQTGTLLQEQGRQFNLAILLNNEAQKRIIEKLSELKFSEKEIKEIFQEKFPVKVPQAQEGEKQPSSQFIAVEYTDLKTPERANAVVNLFINEMVEQSLDINTSQLRTRIKALEERSNEVKKELSAAEEAFYRFISKDGSKLLGIQDGTVFSSITGSEKQQRDIDLSLEQIQGEINSLIKQLGLNPDEAYTSSALSADPIIGSLRAQILQNESQIKLREKDLRPEHPVMVNLRKQQEINEKLLQERAQEIMGGKGQLKPLPSKIRQDSNLDPARQELANRLVVLQTQRDSLLRLKDTVKKTEKDLRQQYEQFPDKQLQQSRLVQELETKRTLYQTIVAALLDAKAAEAETVSSLAVTQPSTVQPIINQPAPPLSRLLILLGGTGAGLIVALGLIFLLATLDDRLHTPEELRDALMQKEVPILGQFPYVFSYDVDGKETSILVDVSSTYLNYYERFRSNLRRLGSDASKVILITSILGEEGKSICAYNLAIASAQAGKRTLLIEADLNSPTRAQTLGIEPDPDAMVQPLHYYASRTDSVRLVPIIENLYVLPSPGPLVQTAAVLESSELRRLLDDARGRFDLVILDTASLSKGNDALLLQTQTDGIVLVTRPGLTRGSMLAETIDQFAEQELPLLGAVINDMEGTATESNAIKERFNPEVNQNLTGSQI